MFTINYFNKFLKVINLIFFIDISKRRNLPYQNFWPTDVSNQLISPVHFDTGVVFVQSLLQNAKTTMEAYSATKYPLLTPI